MLDHARDRTIPSQIEAICRSLSIHLRRKNGVPLDAVEVGIGQHVDHDVQDADFNETRLPSQKYYDQYTGLELDPVGTAAARQAEIDFAWRLKAFESRPRTEAYQRMGRKPFGMRWIECNKGDEQRRELRSRLVVQETRQTSTISASDIAAVTSSTPPLEVVRLFCSLMMSMKGAGGEPLVLQFLNVSRAHPHAEVLRDDFYVETVPEMGPLEDTCLLARRGWYGMRDAQQASEFAHRSIFLLYFVHGDNYVGLGVLHEIRILNRVITYHPAKPGCPEMLTYEADQRHADLLMAAYGLTGSSKAKAIPWDKAAFLARHPLAGTIIGREATSRVPQQLYEMLVLGSRST